MARDVNEVSHRANKRYEKLKKVEDRRRKDDLDVYDGEYIPIPKKKK